MQNIGSFVQSIIFFFLIRTRSLRSGFSSTMFRDYSACYCFSTESNMRTASVECNDVCGFDMTFSSIYSYRFHLSIGAFNPAIYEISSGPLVWYMRDSYNKNERAMLEIICLAVLCFVFFSYTIFAIRISCVKYKRRQDSNLFVMLVYFIRLNEILYIRWARIVTIWNIYDCKCYETRQINTSSRRNRHREQERHKHRVDKRQMRSIKNTTRYR